MEVSQQRRPEEGKQLRELRAALEAGLLSLEGAHSLAAGGQRSPHISSWYFDGVTAESLLVLLDLEGISASSGSACSSHSLEPSRVLLAMGLSPQQSRGLVRFSFGFSSTQQDVDRILEVVPRLVVQVRRKASPGIAG
jgi:cysteine desulfurase